MISNSHFMLNKICVLLLKKNFDFIKSRYTIGMKKIILWILIPSLAIQFIQVDAPILLNSPKKERVDAPIEVMEILQRSCYDCHSNSINYPWYAKIAPLSWYINNHIKNGRKVVNFSQWKRYPLEKQLKIIKKIPKSLVVRMPPADYLWMHEESTLTKEDKKLLIDWAKELQKELDTEK